MHSSTPGAQWFIYLLEVANEGSLKPIYGLTDVVTSNPTIPTEELLGNEAK